MNLINELLVAIGIMNNDPFCEDFYVVAKSYELIENFKSIIAYFKKEFNVRKKVEIKLTSIEREETYNMNMTFEVYNFMNKNFDAHMLSYIMVECLYPDTAIGKNFILQLDKVDNIIKANISF